MEGHPYCPACGARLAGKPVPASTTGIPTKPPDLPASRVALLVSALFLFLICGALTGVAAWQGVQPAKSSPGGVQSGVTPTIPSAAQTPEILFTPTPPHTPVAETPTATRGSSFGLPTATPTLFSLPTETPTLPPTPTATVAPTADPTPTIFSVGG